MQDIPEADWREFKKVRQVLLERFCQGALDQLANAAQTHEGSAHHRYLRAYKLLEQRDKELGRAFNDFRRSTAVIQLTVMRSMGLLTDEQLSGFSEPTRQAVQFLTTPL